MECFTEALEMMFSFIYIKKKAECDISLSINYINYHDNQYCTLRFSDNEFKEFKQASMILKLVTGNMAPKFY
ncbi:hypothetical protein WN51_02743 [Melipona quadrifasciata]|uniref:Uncharacterized protein n=1 Tax=Melipona quadrifasciata TaxID=166423 RepID=A0A0N0U7D9_9HYME|nr:hypothetical protein WN51_02743 [Melipona quadrifasciata]